MERCSLQVEHNLEAYLVFMLSVSFLVITAAKCSFILDFASVNMICFQKYGLGQDKDSDYQNCC